MIKSIYFYLAATFSLPILLAIGESISWVLKAMPIVEILAIRAPVLVSAGLFLWAAFILFSVVKLVWPLSAKANALATIFLSRVLGISFLFIGALYCGIQIVQAYLPVLTLRVV